jgi:hypothetical protein
LSRRSAPPDLNPQRYFGALRTEKMLLLQLAAEDRECSFGRSGHASCAPSGPPSPRPGFVTPRAGGGGGGGADKSWGSEFPAASAAPRSKSQSPSAGARYLDRIERLASADRARSEAKRAAMAAHLLAAQCTFSPEINPRSRRMAAATPLEVRARALSGEGLGELALPPAGWGDPSSRHAPKRIDLSPRAAQYSTQELYANSRGAARRAAIAAELDAQREAECTFSPDTSKGHGCGGPGGGRCGSPVRGPAGHAISCEVRGLAWVSGYHACVPGARRACVLVCGGCCAVPSPPARPLARGTAGWAKPVGARASPVHSAHARRLC